MKKLFFLWILALGVKAQDTGFTATEVAVNDTLKGTLFLPDQVQNPPLVIMIAGSGPTDRNGNQARLKSNCSKYLAEGMARNGIAAYSYDKRIISPALLADLDESKLSFDDFIHDAQAVIRYFKNTYTDITVLGHSEGSLIGMVAAENEGVRSFISLAGAGSPISEVLEFQIGQNAPFLLEETKSILRILEKGEMAEVANPQLLLLFRESVQPYMISWMRYNPQAEIAKLKMPVLIINGTKDIQVKVSEAELLRKAKPEARYVVIENMNHVLKEIKGDMQENIQSYNQPELPVIPQLIETITGFVKK